MHILVVLLVIVCIYWLITRSADRDASDSGSVENKLLHLCLGDKRQCERLIEAELSRAPGITRAQAIERAYGALCRAKL